MINLGNYGKMSSWIFKNGKWEKDKENTKWVLYTKIKTNEEIKLIAAPTTNEVIDLLDKYLRVERANDEHEFKNPVHGKTRPKKFNEVITKINKVIAKYNGVKSLNDY